MVVKLPSNQLLHDNFAHSWDGFQTMLKGLSTFLNFFAFTFGSNLFQTNLIGLDQVIVKAMSSDAGLHRSLFWTNSSYITLRCVVLSEKNDGPTKCKPSGMACHSKMLWQLCCCAQITHSVTSKTSPHHHTTYASQWKPHIQ